MALQSPRAMPGKGGIGARRAGCGGFTGDNFAQSAGSDILWRLL